MLCFVDLNSHRISHGVIRHTNLFLSNVCGQSGGWIWTCHPAFDLTAFICIFFIS
uniref:Uncharacterized protein n=1 Tax=Rhizophora mucronata TaxID=61149 RepID=A0A2P2PU15_RHIMU